MKVKKLNEDTLLEWPWGDKLAGARKKEANASTVNVKNVANKVLAKDFAKEAKMYKFFINGQFTKAYTQDQWKSMFLDATAYLGKPDLSKEQHDVLRQWWEGIVTSPTGVLIRRGIENVEKEYVKIQPNVNTKIAEKYQYDTVFNITEDGETPDDTEDTTSAEEAGTEDSGTTATEDETDTATADGDEEGHEDSTDTEGDGDDSSSDEGEEAPTEAEIERKFGVTKKAFSNFLRLAYTLKLKIFNGMGEAIPIDSAANLQKIKYDQILDYTVEHNGKKHEVTDFIKTLVKNKALTEEMLTEKGWSMKIDAPLAHRFRSIIQDDETDYEALKKVIIEVYENIHRLIPDRFEEYELDDIKDDLEYIDTEVNDDMDEEEIEEEWNYALSNLYDLCDSYNIWIPLEFEESFETDNEEDFIDSTYHDASEEELRKMGAFDNLNDDDEIVDESETLTEAPVITLNDDDMINPTEVNFKDKIAKATAEEEAAKARAERETKIADLRVKHADLLNNVTNALDDDTKPSDVLEILFNALVPPQGKAETVAGELTRAMMRILYRFYNDGDKFFEGYGLETCGGSAEYLYDECLHDDIANMLEDVFSYDDDDRYEEALENCTKRVIDHILENPDLIAEPNEVDSRDYTNEFITDHQPRYEFEIEASDDVVRLVEVGELNAWDLKSYIESTMEWDHVFEGAETERPWSHDSTSITVSNLTKQGYDELEDRLKRPEGFWMDLVEENKDALDRLDNEEEDYEEFDDEDYDSDDDLGEAFSKNFPIEECGESGCEEPLEESYDENFTTYEETLESMMNNDNQEVIDAHIRMLDKIVKILGTTNKDMCIFIDTEDMYNPAWYCEPHSVKNINKILTEYDFEGILKVIVRMSGRGDYVLYFKNKTDARQYLKFVDKENGIV